MDGVELHQLINSADVLRLALRGGKRVNPEEEVTRKFAFASLVATREISAGEYLDETNTVLKRPSGGAFDATNRLSALGRRAAVDIPPNRQIREEWLES